MCIHLGKEELPWGNNCGPVGPSDDISEWDRNGELWVSRFI